MPNMQGGAVVDFVVHSRHSQRAAQPVIANTLAACSAVLSTLQSSHPSLIQLTELVQLLANLDIVGLVLNNVFANSTSTAVSRAAAVQLLSEVSNVCCTLCRAADDAAVASAPARGAHAAAHDAADDSTSTSSAAADSHAAATDAQRSMQPGLVAVLQALVRNVGMPQQSAAPAQLQRRHILRLTLRTLRHICQALPNKVWAGCAADRALCSTFPFPKLMACLLSSLTSMPHTLLLTDDMLVNLIA